MCVFAIGVNPAKMSDAASYRNLNTRPRHHGVCDDLNCSNLVPVARKTQRNMVHANGATNGAAKRGTTQQPLNGAQGSTKNSNGRAKTDYAKWRLKDDRGCQTWHYLEGEEENRAWPQSTADKYFLGLDTVGLRKRSKSCSGMLG